MIKTLIDPLRLRVRYRWDNYDSRVLDRAQDMGAVVQARRAFSCSSTVPTPGGPLTFGYVGIGTGLQTILPLMEQLASDGEVTATRSRVRRGSVPALSADLADLADLVIVGGLRSTTNGSGLPFPCVDAPFRMHLVREIPTDEASLMAQVSKRDRQNFRKDLRTQGFDSEITRDVAELAPFYETMHLPTMRRRHGSQMLSESLVVAEREILACGFLFFVRSHGQRVAGALCTYNPADSIVTTRMLGVADGDEKHYDSGAFKALYHMLSEWCRCNGVRHLDLFATQAWTSRGLFQWKRRLHPHIVPAPNRYKALGLRIHLVRDRPVVRDFMVANPLVTIDEGSGHLVATWFHDQARPQRTDIKVGLPGVTERTIDLDDMLNGTGVRQWHQWM